MVSKATFFAFTVWTANGWATVNAWKTPIGLNWHSKSSTAKGT